MSSMTAPMSAGNLQDHLDVQVQWQCTQPVTLNGTRSIFTQAAALGEMAVRQDRPRELHPDAGRGVRFDA